MKILILADYLPFNFDLKGLLDKEKPEAVFTLGDLKEAQLKALGEYEGPKFGVYGNHCHKGYLENLKIANAHLSLLELDDFSIFGFEGAIGEKNHELSYTQEECHKMIENAPTADILISHCPPFGINDEENSNSHEGIEALLNYVEAYEPLLIFHGHTYPEKEQEISRYKNSIVVYTHGYRILNLTDLDINNMPEATFYVPLRDKNTFYNDDF